jgi:hypothetical protein
MTQVLNRQHDPVEPGFEYPVDHRQAPFGQVSLQCTRVTQRNWTRVGMGRLQAPDGAGQTTVFLKQNIDRGGHSHPEHWVYEQAGADIAHQLLHDIVRVPQLRYQSESLLLNVYDYIDVITIDELLRSDPAAFDRCFDKVIRDMGAVLEAMKQPASAPHLETLPVKSRPYGGPSTALNFKGFEIRNAGLARTEAGAIESGDLVMFDFVRPYLAPIEEAAAKLFVSIGLLNWGKPLTRFVRGPDRKLLERALRPLHPCLDRQAVLEEIDLQSRFRTREFQGSGNLERTLKRLGIDTLGRRYLYKLRRWCERHIE